MIVYQRILITSILFCCAFLNTDLATTEEDKINPEVSLKINEESVLKKHDEVIGIKGLKNRYRRMQYNRARIENLIYQKNKLIEKLAKQVQDKRLAIGKAEEIKTKKEIREKGFNPEQLQRQTQKQTKFKEKQSKRIKELEKEKKRQEQIKQKLEARLEELKKRQELKKFEIEVLESEKDRKDKDKELKPKGQASKIEITEQGQKQKRIAAEQKAKEAAAKKEAKERKRKERQDFLAKHRQDKLKLREERQGKKPVVPARSAAPPAAAPEKYEQSKKILKQRQAREAAELELKKRQRFKEIKQWVEQDLEKRGQKQADTEQQQQRQPGYLFKKLTTEPSEKDTSEISSWSGTFKKIDDWMRKNLW